MTLFNSINGTKIVLKSVIWWMMGGSLKSGRWVDNPFEGATHHPPLFKPPFGRVVYPSSTLFWSTLNFRPPLIRMVHPYEGWSTLMKGDPPFFKCGPPSRVDAATHKKGGFESTYFHPPLKKCGPPLNKGGWKGRKGGPPLKGGCRFVSYTLAKNISNR